MGSTKHTAKTALQKTLCIENTTIYSTATVHTQELHFSANKAEQQISVFLRFHKSYKWDWYNGLVCNVLLFSSHFQVQVGLIICNNHNK